jgi:hypothetical protein
MAKLLCCNPLMSKKDKDNNMAIQQYNNKDCTLKKIKPGQSACTPTGHGWENGFLAIRICGRKQIPPSDRQRQ